VQNAERSGEGMATGAAAVDPVLSSHVPVVTIDPFERSHAI
jgi:hypothetical protein